MTQDDWRSVIDQFADMGGQDVQFIGGEPTLHPGLSDLIRQAHGRHLGVEVFSNLTTVNRELWETFTECGVKLATSYYSDEADEHDAITHLKGSHRRTRRNVQKALDLGLAVRGGVVVTRTEQRAREAATDLIDLGVPQVGGDRTRAFGRGGDGTRAAVTDLCGHCGKGKCAVLPSGEVAPCVLGRYLHAGNVMTTPLADIWYGRRMARMRVDITAVHGEGTTFCTPPQFLPSCGPCGPCVPSVQQCDPRKAGSSAVTINAHG